MRFPAHAAAPAGTLSRPPAHGPGWAGTEPGEAAPAPHPARRLVITADDFGASIAVNRAVERAHREGVLTATSLMVAGEAATDAIATARKLPMLGVGLHLVLVDGRPTLPPDRVPDLVDGDGRFRANMVRAGVDFFFRPAVRRQLAEEIEAQFIAFGATGLKLDHVNAHKHFHLHPTIAGLIVEIGGRFGLRAVRAPVEPPEPLAEVEPASPGRLADRVAAPWARTLQARFASAGLIVPDQVFGLRWSGHMHVGRLAGLIEHLPPGLTEIYLHPATEAGFAGHAPGYDYEAELAALVDERTRAALRLSGARLGSFTDFEEERVAA
ncbi:MULTISPECIES: hopanoid biosynthesis-associated protein HpnK [Sphingomonadales]|uniref:Hopanoid biosynthesis associated protein HpnK n=1 Tax=Edaphosphingomonas haloaromaticamans TaxID=653954 RepID=A0A1S1HP54_9SPHN|nr:MULTISPECIES: hopanoid biosynthesis-associated protein HpnK [Sphingomonas]OHT22160.1 hypothetical protein BHE75_04182 [Sphingomonas haloaromaticamans]